MGQRPEDKGGPIPADYFWAQTKMAIDRSSQPKRDDTDENTNGSDLIDPTVSPCPEAPSSVPPQSSNGQQVQQPVIPVQAATPGQGSVPIQAAVPVQLTAPVQRAVPVVQPAPVTNQPTRQRYTAHETAVFDSVMTTGTLA